MHTRLLPFVLLIGCLATPAKAQDSLNVHLPGVSVGASVGQFFATFDSVLGRGAITTVGLQATYLRPRALGIDVSVALSTRALMEGRLLMASDIGVTYSLPSGRHLVILPQGGASAGVLASRDFAEGVPGVHGGIGALYIWDAGLGVHVELVRHRYFGGIAPDLWSLTVSVINLFQ